MRKWSHTENCLIWEAVENIQEGRSIYSQVKRLRTELLPSRSWSSILSKINRLRKKLGIIAS